MDLSRRGSPGELDAPASASACSAGSPTRADGQPCPGTLSQEGLGVFRLFLSSPGVSAAQCSLPVVWPPCLPALILRCPGGQHPSGKAAASTSLSNQSTGAAGLAQAQGPAFSLAWWFDWSLTLTLLGPSILSKPWVLEAHPGL